MFSEIVQSEKERQITTNFSYAEKNKTKIWCHSTVDQLGSTRG